MTPTRPRRIARQAVMALAGVAGMVLLVSAIQAMSNPLRQSDAGVREWLFTQTPRGLSKDEALSFLEERGWHEPGPHEEIPPPATEPFMGGTIGYYQDLESFPFVTVVRAFWEFDSDGRLVDIRIVRWIDSP